MANRIDFQVGYTVDKTGLNEIKSSLQAIQKEARGMSNSSGLSDELKKAATAAKELETILDKSWNNKIGQLDLSKFNSQVKATWGGVSNLKRELESSGTIGANAYNTVARSVLNTNIQLRESSKLLDSMATTMGHTIKWGIASSVMNSFTGSVQQAYGYVKNLDGSLNDIRIVTGKSADEMANFAVQANKAAQGLAKSTTDYTNASLIYYQQGLSDKEVAARTETTLKAANVTGQSTAEVSEQLTAVWNGYKVSAAEAETYIDKLAAVAATTASDLEELSVGMSKVASAAAAMGVDVDKLNGMLSTVISVTRQAPESAGTAFKTIFARMEDLELGKKDDEGVGLGEVSSSLKKMGVDIMTAEGSLRNLGDVIEEVGNKWNDGAWSDAEKQALAIDLAGKRQYNNLLALFENWEMYNDAVQASINSVGTLQDQQDIYMESTAAHIQQLKTAEEDLWDSLLDSDTINTITDGLRIITEQITNFVDGLGGGLETLVFLAGTVGNVFNNQIGGWIGRQISNLEVYQQNLDQIEAKQAIIDAHAVNGQNVSNDAALTKEVEIANRLLLVRKNLTAEQYNELTGEQQQVGLLEQQIQELTNYGVLLKNIGLTEKESVQTIRSAVEGKEVELQAQKILLEYLELCNLSLEGTMQHSTRIDELNNEIFDENSHTAEILAGISREQLSILETVQDNALEHEQVNQLVEQQRILVQNTEQSVIDGNRALQQREAIENGELENLQRQQAARENLINLSVQQAERQGAINATIQGIGILTSGLTTIAGIIRTINNESMSLGEKVSAIFTSMMFMLPQIITGWSSFWHLMPNLAVSIGAVGAASEVTGLQAVKAILMTETALGPLGWVIMGITAAVTALGFVIHGMIEAWNADANAMKEANETARELKENYEELKTTYEELENAISNYQDARTALDELTKGTEEWDAAVQSLNEQVLDLIGKYPELLSMSDAITTNADGLLEISESGQKAILQIQNQRTKEGYEAQLGGQIYANKATNTSAITDFRREAVRLDDIVQPGYDSEGTFNEIINALISALEENGNQILQSKEALADAVGISERQADALLENKDALNNLIDTIETNNKENELYRQQLGQSALQNTKYADSQYSEVLGQIFGDALSAKFDEVWENGNYKDGGFFSGKDDSIVQRDYAKKIGASDSRNLDDDKGKYLINGEWKTIEDDIARTALAMDDAKEQVSKSLDDVAKSLENFANITNSESDNVKQALTNLITGSTDLSNLTRAELEELSKTDLSKVSDKDLKNLGVSREDLTKTFEKAINLGRDNFDNIAKDMVTPVKKAFSEIDTSKMTLAAQQFIKDTYTTANAFGVLDDAIAAQKTGKLEEFAEGLKSVANAAQDSAKVAFDSEQYGKAHKEINSIQVGDTVSEDTYNALNEQAQEYLSATLDGTYKLTKSAEEFRKIAEDGLIGLDNAIAKVQQLEELQSKDFNSISQPVDLQGMGQIGIGVNRDAIQEQIDLVSELGDQSTETKIQIAEWQDQLNNNVIGQESLNQLAEAAEKCRGRFEGLSEEIAQAKNAIEEQRAALAMSQTNFEDLQKLLDSGQISAEQFQDAYEALSNKLDEDVDTKAFESLKDYLKDNADEIDDLNDKIKDNEDALDDVTEAILRYDSAIEDVQNNLENWKELLKSDNLQDQAQAIEELRNVYSDLLNMDGSSLSDNFLSSTENLKLLEEAAKGSEDAYNSLLEAAQQDIEANVTLKDDDFYDKKLALENALDKINLDKIEIGAFIDDTNAIAAMNNLINAAGFTAKQATDYLGSMGVDAEVETTSVPETQKQGFVNAVPRVEYEDVTVPNVVQDGSIEDTTVQMPKIIYEGESSTEEVEGEKMATALRVKSASKASGGGFKFKNSSHGSGNAGRTARKPSGGGGGGRKRKPGGSKKSNKKEPNKIEKKEKTDAIEKLKVEVDRYHDIDVVLKRLANSYDKLSKAQSKLFGKELIDNLNKQLQILEKQKKAQQEKLKIARKELNELHGEIKIKNGEKIKTGLLASGVKFDKNGYISNYEDAYKKQYKSVNNLIAQRNKEAKKFDKEYEKMRKKYNSMSAEDQEKYKNKMKALEEGAKQKLDELDKGIKKAKDKLADWEDEIARYDELKLTIIPELKEDWQDAVNEQIEINIAKFNMAIELRLDLAQAQRDWNEFRRKVIDDIRDDDILGNATSKFRDIFTYFNSDKAAADKFLSGGARAVAENSFISDNSLIKTLTQKVQDDKDELDKIDAILAVQNNKDLTDAKKAKELAKLNSPIFFGKDGTLDKAAALQQLKEDNEKLQETLMALKDLEKEIEQSYLDMIDKSIEAFDKQVDKYEFTNNLIKHDLTLIDLVGAKYAAQNGTIYQQKEKYYKKSEENNNKELDFLKKRIAYAREMMAIETDLEAKEKWEKEWQTALEKLNSKVEESIQNLTNKYQNAIAQAFDKLNKKITGGKSLDYVSDEWDLINKNADRYLDTINSLYAVQSLENKYLEAINNTDSVSAQQKLKSVMDEQVKSLQDKEKLTQYDVDRANKLYEIALKQIALEEAQQNKSKMRLRRDAQGNYSYQFVSDEDDTTQKRQDLLDAQNDLYNFDKTAYRENLNQIYDYYLEFQQKYNDIMTDMSLTDEERQERRLLLEKEYGQLIDGLTQSNLEIRSNLQKSAFQALEGQYNINAENFKLMTDKDIEYFRNMTDTEKDLMMEELVPQWDSSVQHMSDTFVGNGGFVPTCQDGFGKMSDAATAYQEDLDELQEAAGQDFEKIGQGLDENIDKAETLTADNDALINSWKQQTDAVRELVAELKE